MGTQYTGGQTAKQVLTAATTNSIVGKLNTNRLGW